MTITKEHAPQTYQTDALPALPEESMVDQSTETIFDTATDDVDTIIEHILEEHNSGREIASALQVLGHRNTDRTVREQLIGSGNWTDTFILRRADQRGVDERIQATTYEAEPGVSATSYRVEIYGSTDYELRINTVDCNPHVYKVNPYDKTREQVADPEVVKHIESDFLHRMVHAQGKQEERNEVDAAKEDLSALKLLTGVDPDLRKMKIYEQEVKQRELEGRREQYTVGLSPADRYSQARARVALEFEVEQP